MKMDKKVIYIAINTENNEPILKDSSYERVVKYINAYNRKIDYTALKIVKATTTYEEV